MRAVLSPGILWPCKTQRALKIEPANLPASNSIVAVSSSGASSAPWNSCEAAEPARAIAA